MSKGFSGTVKYATDDTWDFSYCFLEKTVGWFHNQVGKTPLAPLLSWAIDFTECSSPQLFSSFTHYRWNVAILGKVDIQVDLAWEFILNLSTSVSENRCSQDVRDNILLNTWILGKKAIFGLIWSGNE